MAFGGSGLGEATAGQETSKKVGVAVVGLGAVGFGSVIPAIASSQRCELVGVVSGTASKARSAAAAAGFTDDSIYGYEDFDRIAADSRIDVLYVAVPTGKHLEVVARAAQAGKHVVVESPMARSSNEALAMQEVCARFGTQIVIADRSATRFGLEDWDAARALVQSGSIRKIATVIGQQIRGQGDWRVDPSVSGGGALLGLGCEALRSIRAMCTEQPVSVVAQESKVHVERFARVDESVTWTMTFESGVEAHGAVTYRPQQATVLQVLGGRSAGESRWTEVFNPSVAGSVSQGANERAFVQTLDAFAGWICDRHRGSDRPAGILTADEGVQELRMVEAIYRSMSRGSEVSLIRHS
jgi:predicted dehydrogenase